ncbi:universal stress protein [Saccharibacillus sp. CPCC 101409]|uniref:universal stress protein n=1 Tax=Saccharibacillus sp. CPCC 101409 TaxID=3058041 RepID=UPI002672B4C7|nr:universal stress protein [Saccharibacillus sp. CPCC 101409]MDO3413207.1 universal stress protein [Saccharibacillus sp. CPCC 101409]
MLFSKILLAYDGSNASNKALERAIGLAQATPGAALEVLHIYDYPRFFVGDGIAPVPGSVNKEFFDLAEQTVEEARRRIAEAGVEARIEMRQGAPAVLILEYAKELGADVIVIGSRGLGAIREFVLGSVSHNVVQHSEIPVLIVK